MNKVVPMPLGFSRGQQPADSLFATVMHALDSASKLVVHEPGETLFMLGQKPADVLILLEGKVKLSMDSEDGRTLIFGIAEPKEILGLPNILAGESYDKIAITLTLCRVAYLAMSDFTCLLRCNPSAVMLAFRELHRSYNQACNQIQMLGMPFIPARLARAILQWSMSGQSSERRFRFHMPMNHSEIGEYIGARRETVTRVLGEFQRRGLIEIRGPIFTVTDRRGLEFCAGHPYGGDGFA